jgi:vitamin B12 transporter
MRENAFIVQFGMVFLWLLPFLPIFTGTVFGESNNGGDAPAVMHEVVVTAERLQEYIKNHPQEAQSVDREEIVKRNLSSVEDVLKTMPGVEVYTSSGIGSRVSIRGSGKSGGILMLLNGRPLNSNQYGGLDLNSIPVDMIESVTVFKPPIPIWLGPGGSEGAINIVTRSAVPADKKKKAQGSAKLGGGSYGFVEGALSSQCSTTESSALLTATAKHVDGRRTNSDRTDGTLSMNVSRDAGSGRFSMNGRYYHAEYGSPGPIDNATPNARQEYQKGSLDAGFKGAIGAIGTYTLGPYGDMVKLKDRSQTGIVYPLRDDKIGLKFDAAWTQEQGGWELRLGGMTEYDAFDHSLAGSHHRFRNGLNSQYDQRIGSLTATVGARADHTNDFEFNPGFFGGLGWGVTDRLLFKIRAGYAVNVPTFEQLYQTSHGSIDQARGNPDLQEENIWSYTAGIEYAFAKDRLFHIMLFRYDTSDLIGYQRGVDLIYRPFNISRAVRQGIETTARYGWENGLTLELNLILQNSSNSETGGDLPYTPKIKVKSGVQYAVPSLKTRLECAVRYEGERFSQIENLPSQKMAEYTVVDLKAIQSFTLAGKTADLYAVIDNVFDKRYQAHLGYPNDGFRFNAGLQMRF